MDVTVNMHEAKSQLSRLVEQALAGHDVTIARAGQPVVKLVAIRKPPARRKLGPLAGKGIAVGDIKRDFEADIEEMFKDYLPPR
jgi:prevent-host-death family protein